MVVLGAITALWLWIPSLRASQLPPTAVSYSVNPNRNDVATVVTLSGGSALGAPMVEWSIDGETWSSAGATVISGSQVSLLLTTPEIYFIRAAWGATAETGQSAWTLANDDLLIQQALQGSASGLQAAWSFSAGSGTTVTDWTGNGHDITGFSATWATGKYGSGMHFTRSSSQRATLGSASELSLTGAITVSLWCKFDSLSGEQNLLSKYELGGYGLDISSTGQMEFSVYVGGQYRVASESISNYTTGTWYHLVGVYDGATVKLYRNGVLRSSVNQTGSIGTSSIPVSLGTNQDLSPTVYRDFFDGTLDEVRIYSLALTSDEVGQLGSLGQVDELFAQPSLAITSAASASFGSGYTATATGGSGTGALVWSLGTGSTAAGAAINATTGEVTSSGVGTVVIKVYRAADAQHSQSATTSDFTITLGKGNQSAPTAISLSNSSVQIGGSVTVTVSGGGSGSWSAGASLEWSSDAGSTWNSTALVAGSISGTVGSTSQPFVFTPPVLGTYQFRANWLESSTYNASSQYAGGQNLVANQLPPTAISYSVNPNRNDVATVVTLSGGSALGAPIVEWSIDGVTWSSAGATVISSSQVSLLLTTPEIYFIRAAWGATTEAGRSVWTLANDELTIQQALQGSASGLQAAWSFSAGSGTTVTDWTGNGHDITGFSATWATGKYGSGMHFTRSSSQRATLGSASELSLTGAITVSLWCKFDSLSGEQNLLSKYELGGYGLDISSTGQMEFSVYVGGQYRVASESISNYSTGTWYHLVGVYDGATVKLYRNGVLRSSVNQTGSIGTSSIPVSLGANQDLSPTTFYRDFLNGTLDEVRIYNVALTSTEVAQLSSLQQPDGLLTQASLAITSATSASFGSGYTATAAGGSGTGALVWSLGTGSTATGAAINASTGEVTTSGLGTVVINAYRAGDAQHSQSETTDDFTITIGKGNQSAPTAISLSNSSVQIGGSVTVTVSGGGSGPWSAGASLEWSNDGGSTWNSTALVAGSISGSVGSTSQPFVFTPPVLDTYQFRANWLESSTYNASSQYAGGQNLVANQLPPTAISYSVNPNRNDVATVVTLSGGSALGAPIVEWSIDGVTWSSAGATVISSSQVSLLLTTPETYSVRAAWGATAEIGQSAWTLAGTNLAIQQALQGSASGLQAAWSFSAGSGTTVADWTGNGHDITGFSATWATGKYGSGMHFTRSSSQRATLGSASELSLTGAITVSLWCKFDSLTAPQNLLSKYEAGGYGIDITSTKVEFSVYIAGQYRVVGESISNYATGTWYHLVGVYDGANLKFYRDGVLRSSASQTGSIVTSSIPVSLGANQDLTPSTLYRDFFNGTLDEVRIYNVALTSDEVVQLGTLQAP